tara:strand:+ start:17352 stop:17591 length:240 start_codon:yes stop_codon:yes gene_type:complete
MIKSKTKKQLIDEVSALIEDAKDNVRLLQISDHRLRTLKRNAGKMRYDLHYLDLSKEDKITVMTIVDNFMNSLPNSQGK